MKDAVWKRPGIKGTVTAKGNCLTKEDVLMAKKKAGFSGKSSSPYGGKIVIAIALVVIALLVVYG